MVEHRKVWVLCVKEDHAYIKVLRELLHPYGIDISGNLSLGENALSESIEQVKASDQVILIYSDNALNEPQFNVDKLIGYFSAALKKKDGYLIPIVMGDIELPPDIREAIVADFNNDGKAAEKLSNAILARRKPKAKPNFSNLHILTSVKGGVGRTLVGLGIVSSYDNSDMKALSSRKLLAVDLNHMNTDLFNILLHTTNNQSSPERPAEWLGIQLTKNIRAAYFFDRHVLPDGSKGFWKRLSKLINQRKYQKFDILVDTNLNIANLLTGLGKKDSVMTGANTETEVHEIVEALKHDDRRLFFWVFWTWASLRNAMVTNEGNIIDDTVGSALQFIPQEIKDRITLIHVLNPSAMLQHQPDIDKVKEILTEAKQMIQAVHVAQEKYSISDDSFSNNSFIAEQFREVEEFAKKKIETLQRQILELVTKLDHLNNEEKTFEGLRKLNIDSNLDQEFVEYDLFVQQVNNFLSTLDPKEFFANDYRGLFEEFHLKRPINLLAISTYDPNLRGYTDRLALYPVKSIEDIRLNIKWIEKDVGNFLQNLIAKSYK